MKAAVLHGIRDVRIEDVPLPDPTGVGSTLVRVDAVGVCGSDVLRFGTGKGYGFPLVLGHEMSGTLAEDSPSGRLMAGTRVAIFPCLPRPDDPMTEIGEYALGTDYDYFGSRRDGGLEEFLQVPERNLFALREDMTLLEGAMVEPAGVALHAVRKAPVPANATALVIGAGPIGMLAAQWLRVLGATRVIVADVDARKRALAERLGFETIDAAAGASDEQALESTGGRGVDIAVEASGLAVTFLQAINAAAHAGHVILLGDLRDDAVLAKEIVSRILRRELVLHGTWNAKIAPRDRSEWDMVIAHLGRTVNVGDLISHVVDFEDAQQSFTALADRALWSNKTIFAVSDAARSEASAALARSFSAEVMA
ncbi:galactitol-1-phosphate 5-dehydrogenase [Microbacterium trichothecenolyticum]|uniref:galactitol-1-phosphate 5-dehydrogenase n=1 Tax=Microbacterium trichothecenolyticum TaxID=69370 RepID=UPI001C6F3BAB|nr:galactitol-1-phosphate 5-dehydrogenase [Microbacterium trichothecenolyticum]MBW9121758.1 galactitol-1-phosphate 5-dehydrogenase [Microbacterium trichothecenolyticum]